MGIVKISDELHEEIRHASAVMGRSINGQAEFWIKIGLLAELYPDLTYPQLTRKLLAHPELTIREVLDDVS
ncbi:ParD-like family protein [Saccharospirillum salsuginis]|uniref:ParD-like antitoxin of type II toxin-antitoxin system n=1 Tax=Saccharospirillum salsuginis TaxID=418750 RepID=A0A918KDM3_9GAMM|nr:ParD-like family protein [Saccharospirillum salsuginis]GGX58149.1 hypothetical protein GCM10007392_27370 [Saccharospirillum salsuginis]